LITGQRRMPKSIRILSLFKKEGYLKFPPGNIIVIITGNKSLPTTFPVFPPGADHSLATGNRPIIS
jgi:hypothetical protein